MVESGISFIQNIPGKVKHISDELFMSVKRSVYSLPMYIHKHQLYLFEKNTAKYL